MKLFHGTHAKNAANILKRGFRDTTRCYMMNTTVTGVWVSDKILDESESAFCDVVLQIEAKVSKINLDFYEVKEAGKPYREWCIPASILNKGKISELSQPKAIGKHSLHQRPVETSWRDNACGIEELIWTRRQIRNGKQIDPIGVRKIRAVLHGKIVA